MIAIKVFVEGRVQGVFFRKYTQEMALSLGLVGWVRNCADGRVEAVFQGAQKSVNDMVKWCQKGSPSSQVLTVKTEIFLEELNCKSFEIRA